MDTWDDEELRSESPTANVVSDKWEGEDEDDALKDNWDDEEEEKKPKVVEAPKPKQEPKKGGKKYLNKKLKEKEEEEKKEAEERRQRQDNETPEEKLAKQLLAQKLSEESELEMMIGQLNTKEVDSDKVTIDSFKPKTKEDFNRFAELLKNKLLSVEDSPHYYYLLETVITSAMVKLDAESLKKISLPISALSNEKLKLEKQKKGVKKGQKAKLGGGIKASRNDALDDFSQYDDLDDFM